MEFRDDRGSTGEEIPEGDRGPAPGPSDPPEADPQEVGAAPPGVSWTAGTGETAGATIPPPGGEAIPGGGPEPRKGRAKRPFGSFFEVALVVLLALFLALLLKVYVAEAYEIRGRSMEPTFQEEQRVMVLKVFYGIQRGDIIIFASVENRTKDLIKRVIGLPGDMVEMRDGMVFVNGEKLEEPYVRPNNRQENHLPERVPPGKYYVLGDNRPDSQDSRVFHPIDASSIKGKVVLRWWPLEKLGSF